MKKLLVNRKGSLILVVFLILILLIISIAIFKEFKSSTKLEQRASSLSATQSSVNHQTRQQNTDFNEPPLKLKSIGFNLDYYDPVTGMAGEMKFVRYNLFANEIWGDFGQQDPRSPNDPTKRNPQPTFVLPLTTKVHSLVDGEVVNVEKLYSDDYSIMVAKDKSSSFIYETEHVINPLVKIGDRVSGGQIIADVSPHGSPGAGIGILEIGILHPENTEAGHLCPFKYLDDAIKVDIQKKITALYKSWEYYLGKNVYDESNMVSPGCVIEDWVRG